MVRKKKTDLGGEGRNQPYLVTGSDVFGGPTDIFLEAESESDAKRKAIALIKEGKLRNHFGGKIKGPLKVKKVSWEFVDSYLSGIEERHKVLYLEGNPQEAREVVKGGGGWLTSWDVPISAVMRAPATAEGRSNLFEVSSYRAMPELTPQRRAPGNGDSGGHSNSPDKRGKDGPEAAGKV